MNNKDRKFVAGYMGWRATTSGWWREGDSGSMLVNFDLNDVGACINEIKRRRDWDAFLTYVAWQYPGHRYNEANAQGDVWEIPQARDNKHPAPFPIELAQRCISATIEGVVFDPFMGSGTTALAAEILNREWIGAEISNQYCTMAQKRIRDYEKQS